LRTTITSQDGTVVLDGRALVWTEPLARGGSGSSQGHSG